VLEGEEVADAVHRFAHQHRPRVDAAAKQQLLRHVCGSRADQQLPPCSRDLALVLNATVRTGLGHGSHREEDEAWFPFDEGPAVASPLVVWENEEPADVIHRCVDLRPASRLF
jgi:hypothetical protein